MGGSLLLVSRGPGGGLSVLLMTALGTVSGPGGRRPGTPGGGDGDGYGDHKNDRRLDDWRGGGHRWPWRHDAPRRRGPDGARAGYAWGPWGLEVLWGGEQAGGDVSPWMYVTACCMGRPEGKAVSHGCHMDATVPYDTPSC
jgi:hypothetical protein